MAFKTNMIREKHVLIQTVEEGFRGADIALLFAEAFKWLDATETPIFYVIDIRATDIRFGDIVVGANMATVGERPAFHHPRVMETLVVTHSSAIRMAAEGLATPLYGSVKIRVFETLDQAMTYCDQSMSAA
jgi:hypothetical protein